MGPTQDSEGAPSEPGPAEVTAAVRPEPHDPGSSGFWWIPGGMLAAAAAAIVLWWVWPPSQDLRELQADGPKLAQRDAQAKYVLETDGGLESPPGGEDSTGESARHRYRRESAFEWVLRPRLTVAGEVGVLGFAFVDGGSAGLPLALAKSVDIAESGTIRISGKISALELEPGAYTIALVVGPPDSLPDQAADLVGPKQPNAGAGDRGGDHPWEVRHVDIAIED